MWGEGVIAYRGELVKRVIDEVVKEVDDLVSRLREKIYLSNDILRKILTTLVLLKKIHSESRDDEETKELVNIFFAGRPPKGILLYGPPGTGKSYLMSVLERIREKTKEEEEINKFAVVKISGPEIVSAYYGESERNLRRVFRRARLILDDDGLR